MPLTDLQLAAYPTLAYVRQRNSVTLSNWSAYTRSLPMPQNGKPDENLVRRLIVAERIPAQMDSYVTRTLWWFAADPAVREHPEYLSEYNSADVEQELAQHNQDILGTFIDQFARQDVTPDQVQLWYVQHGFAQAEPLRMP